jgi:diguanylate cyclase (GGDEF)-like protein
MPASTLAATAAAAIIAAIYAIHVLVLHRELGTWKRDPLTGLPLRRAFEHQVRARRLLRHPGAVVLFIDLDRFKQVNDLHGHRAGDRVLVAVADRIRRHFDHRAVVTRLSGDEFAVVALINGDWRGVGKSLLASLFDPIDITPDGQIRTTKRIGASIGIVPLAGVSRPVLSGVLQFAEEQSYQAKFRHGGGVAGTDQPDLDRLTTPADKQPLLRLRDLRPSARSGR